MAEMSAIWLRVAAVLYSIGLLHAILNILRRKDSLLRVAFAAQRIAVVFHLVSVVEEGLLTGSFPANNVYQSVSLCALLVALVFLGISKKYKLESLSVAVFPLVFVMTMVAALSRPVTAWTNPIVRSAWLTTHVVLALLAYASLFLTAVGSVVYLFQERELKHKKPHQFYYRLPPLGTLDELISRSMTSGFVFLTLAVIASSTWAFIYVGTRWIDNPEVVISLATWCICLVMVFLRVSAGWRGRKAAIMALTALGSAAVTWVTHIGLYVTLAR
jgi:ABC-type uncharacterized transport system permease subunit